MKFAHKTLLGTLSETTDVVKTFSNLRSWQERDPAVVNLSSSVFAWLKTICAANQVKAHFPCFIQIECDQRGIIAKYLINLPQTSILKWYFHWSSHCSFLNSFRKRLSNGKVLLQRETLLPLKLQFSLLQIGSFLCFRHRPSSNSPFRGRYQLYRDYKILRWTWISLIQLHFQGSGILHKRGRRLYWELGITICRRQYVSVHLPQREKVRHIGLWPDRRFSTKVRTGKNVYPYMQ